LVDRHYRWNLGIHLVQGAFALFAIGIFAPETVLAAYLTTLTKSRFLISLPWALAQCYWYILSVFYCYYIERHRQRKGVLVGLSLALRAGFILFAVSAIVAPRYGAAAAIAVFLCAEGLIVLTGSGASLAQHDFSGRVLPPARRGLFVGLREGTGQAAAFVGSALLYLYLSGRVVTTGDYILPFTAGALAYLVSVVPFALAREPRWPGEAAPPGSWRSYYAQTFSILKTDANFRTYVFVRCLLATTAIFNLGLFASYAITEFGVSRALVSGLFTAASLAGGVIAAPLSGHVADRMGFKVALLGGVAATILMLVMGLVLQWTGDFATLVFLFIYFLAGAQGTAIWVANFNLMIEFGKVEARPRYIALTMLFAAPVGVSAALASGLLADLVGYRMVMLIALAVSIAIWITVYRVFHEPRLHRAGQAAPGEAADGPEASR
jgi:MFS family permease